MPATGARIEVQAGTSWLDITGDVRHKDRVKIVRGRSDQAAKVDPGKCSFTINNKGGKYSPRNPRSSLYGLIGRNTPVRVSAVGGRPWLDHPAPGTPTQRFRVTTPSTSALQITGSLDFRVDVETPDLDDLSGVVELGGKWGPAGQKAWHAYLFAGSIRLVWSLDGTAEVTAAAPVPLAIRTARMRYRITMDVDNGSGGRTVQFFYGPTLDGPWTQLGVDNVIAGTAATASSTAPLEIGDGANVGNVHISARIFAAQVRSGIGGTLVAAPDFTAQAPGSLSFIDSVGVPWTANTVDALSNRRTRFLGEIAQWPTRWDVSGGDVYVPIQAAGIKRRLQAGSAPLDSTLRRRIPSGAGMLAYWPMEEGEGATQAYSPLPGVAPMRVSGLQFGQDDSLPGSSALPVVGEAASFTATAPRGTTAGAGWRVEMVYKLPGMPGSLLPLVQVQTSDAKTIMVSVQTNNIVLAVLDDDGNTVVSNSVTAPEFNDNWGRLQIFSVQDGSVVDVFLRWIVIGTPAAHSVGTSYTGTVGKAVRVSGNWALSHFDGLRIGHIAVTDDDTSFIFDNADKGFDSEQAVGRISRLCAEQAVPLLLPYGQPSTTALGPQERAKTLDILQSAADADFGILYEAREALALAFRPRVSLYSQPVALALDYSKRGEVAPPLEPTPDDTNTRNDITKSRPAGSSARAQLLTGPLSVQAPPLGVGVYDTSDEVNVHSDDQLPDIAGWALHLGTWDEDRYPAVTVNLTAGPWLTEAATLVDVGDRIQIANPPPWLPPETIDLIAQGYAETIGWADWTITYNTTPAGPWDVGAVDDSAARADTAGSTLAAAVSASDTLLPVTTQAGSAPWTTDPAEFPFNVRLGGEVVTVTSIGGSVADAFGRTVASGWGTADTGQAWTTTGGSSADYSVQGV